MDSLLAGTLIFPWRVHCAGLKSSAAVPVENIPGIVKAIPGSSENRSPSSRNHCSPSAWNRFHVRPESAVKIDTTDAAIHRVPDVCRRGFCGSPLTLGAGLPAPSEQGLNEWIQNVFNFFQNLDAR